VVRQALILAGGRGTRLGALTDGCPKPILSVGGRPFLAYLLGLLARQGVRNVILSTGYHAESIRHAFPGGTVNGLEIQHSVETTPMGTGGAILLARPLLQDTFLVLNGDTLFDHDAQVLNKLLLSRSGALGAIALREIDDAGRYGCVRLDHAVIRAFAEKSTSGRGVINGGVYCLKQAALDGLPFRPCSIERDIFPHLIEQGKLLGQVFAGYFIDIGIPETLARAQTELPDWERKQAIASS